MRVIRGRWWWRSVTGMAWDRPSEQAVAAASAELEAAETDAHNARDLRGEIEEHLLDAQHSLDLARGCLEDLAVYLPEMPA